MSATIPCNVWITTDTKAWNYGRQLVLFRKGTFEEDMQEAARWFQCAVTSLKCEAVELTEKEVNELQTEDDE